MHIYLKNNPAKFHPDPIWNDGTLGFFEDHRASPQQKEERIARWLVIWDQFLIQQLLTDNMMMWSFGTQTLQLGLYTDWGLHLTMHWTIDTAAVHFCAPIITSYLCLLYTSDAADE